MRQLKLAATAVAAAIPLASMVAFSAPASADAMHARPAHGTPAISSSCPAHYFCTWKNSGYSGTEWSFNQNIEGNGWFYVGNYEPGSNDQISSFINARGWWTDVSKNYPWNNPDNACIENGLEYSNLADYHWADGSSANDSISGIRLTSDTAQECPYKLS